MRWKLASAAALAGLGVATPALAAWTASGSAVGRAAATSLGAPGTPTGSAATTNSMTLSWSAATAFASGSVSYWVERAAFGGSTWADACGTTESAPIAGLMCSDTGLTASTDYQYRVTSVYQLWRKVGTTSAKLSTAANAVYTYAISPAIAGDKTAGSAFAINVTRSDAYSGTAPLTFSGGTTSPSGQAPSYPAAGTTFTFVNGTATLPLDRQLTLYSAGSNIVSVTDGVRSGTGSVTVIPAAAQLGFTGTTVGGTAATCSSTTELAVNNNNTVFSTRVMLTPKDSWGNTRSIPTSGSISVNVTRNAVVDAEFNTFTNSAQTVTLTTTSSSSPAATPFSMKRLRSSAFTGGVITITDPTGTYASNTCLIKAV